LILFSFDHPTYCRRAVDTPYSSRQRPQQSTPAITIIHEIPLSQASDRGRGEEEWAQLFNTHEVATGGTESHPGHRGVTEGNPDPPDTESALTNEL
jgi:hypothetical protein